METVCRLPLLAENTSGLYIKLTCQTHFILFFPVGYFLLNGLRQSHPSFHLEHP